MQQEQPFPVPTRFWPDLSERDRSFFCGDHYLPLPASHAGQIALVLPPDNSRLAAWAFSGIPPGWPDRRGAGFEHQALLNVADCWDDTARRADVTRWLFNHGIPFRQTVYLVYERDRVVQTTWRMVVRYWDAFAWQVGYAMLAVDHTLQWACCFHHEEMFVFGSRRQLRRVRRGVQR